ncbi:MAG: hypothetical protein AAF771_08580 [Pseudomonadota bacterium]
MEQRHLQAEGPTGTSNRASSPIGNPRTCVFFVVDGRKLEAQACMLAASLKRHLAGSVDVIAYRRADYRVSDFTQSLLQSCEIELRHMAGTGPGSPAIWSRDWPVGNKLLAKAEPRDCDISVYLDTDMLLRAPVDFAAELGEAEVLACVADYIFGPLDTPDAWRKLYSHFGLDLPEERVTLLAGRKLELPPYFNGGFAIFREAPIGEGRERFGAAWLRDCLEIDAAEGFEDEREGLDQTLYPVTIRRLGARLALGRQALNFNVQAHGAAPGSDIAIAHYHNFATIFRRNPQLGYEAIDNIIETFGETQARAFIEEFRSELGWDRPKFITPRQINQRLARIARPGPPNLSELAVKFGSDKGPQKHRYSELYQMLFRPYADDEINFLEMGLLIGGPEHGKSKDRETRDCPSIRMWLEFFSKAQIFGLDVSDFSWVRHERFTFYRCDMENRSEISRTAAELPALDIVVDDASHASHHQQHAFLELFPRVKSGGLYIIEDLRWQPPGMEREGFTKTADLFQGYQVERTFRHDDPALQRQFDALANDVSGCFVFQEGYAKSGRDQVAVIHKV